jgi:mRNA interferase MazF
LRVPSTVRLSRLDCLEKNLLLAKLGRISSEDAVYLLKAWDNYIKPQF